MIIFRKTSGEIQELIRKGIRIEVVSNPPTKSVLYLLLEEIIEVGNFPTEELENLLSILSLLIKIEIEMKPREILLLAFIYFVFYYSIKKNRNLEKQLEELKTSNRRFAQDIKTLETFGQIGIKSRKAFLMSDFFKYKIQKKK